MCACACERECLLDVLRVIYCVHKKARETVLSRVLLYK